MIEHWVSVKCKDYDMNIYLKKKPYVLENGLYIYRVTMNSRYSFLLTTFMFLKISFYFTKHQTGF